MKAEVNLQDTNRAEAFELWMSSPMPMVTLTKTFNVSNLVKASRKAGVKFNALLCWCIGKAATQAEEFYLLPENGRLFQYDCIAVNVIVNNSKGKKGWYLPSSGEIGKLYSNSPVLTK